MLETYLREQRLRRPILLMTHIVAGYPDFDTCEAVVDRMVAAGVDLMELQIPFSEPIADGPVILAANQHALDRGATVARCLDFGRRMAARHPIPFVFMSYTNILWRYGLERFAADTAAAGLRGAIVPDLPPEEGDGYERAMAAHDLAPIYILSPSTSDARLRYLAARSRGFVYCVARKGVTGADTAFSAELGRYLERCRRATDLPLAVGFGVKEPQDVAFLTGRADIAVVGTATLRLVAEKGPEAVGPFLSRLRPA